MHFPKLSKNRLLIIGLVLVAVVGFYLFRSSASEPEPLTAIESGLPTTIGQELIIEVNRLTALRNIKKDIFQDPIFVSLGDFTQVVVPQPLGRPNPFAPVGSDF